MPFRLRDDGDGDDDAIAAVSAAALRADRALTLSIPAAAEAGAFGHVAASPVTIAGAPSRARRHRAGSPVIPASGPAAEPQPGSATASPSGDMTSVQPQLRAPVRATPAGQAKA